ncbi:MAG: hypothetical protein QM742_01325 [Aquabacterium sp.]
MSSMPSSIPSSKPWAPPRAAVTTLGIVALLAMVVACLSWQPGLDGIRMAIRATARSSLAFFLLAYGAAAAFTLWPGSATRWIRALRRQWGWLLVVSHTLHAACIHAYWQTDPVMFKALVPVSTFITGGLAYAFIWAMGATSFDRTAAWIGPRAWKLLHTWGSHYLWLSFLLGNAKRIPMMPVYTLPTLLLLAVLLLRWMASRQRRLKAGSASVAPA